MIWAKLTILNKLKSQNIRSEAYKSILQAENQRVKS